MSGFPHRALRRARAAPHCPIPAVRTGLERSNYAIAREKIDSPEQTVMMQRPLAHPPRKTRLTTFRTERLMAT